MALSHGAEEGSAPWAAATVDRPVGAASEELTVSMSSWAPATVDVTDDPGALPPPPWGPSGFESAAVEWARQEDDGEEPTLYRGDRPPRPSSSRRLSPTLMRIFQRKREQIGLSIAQIAELTGIEESELVRFEGTGGGHRLIYDHAVLVARVLGLRPQDLPGLRAKEGRDAVGAALGSLATALFAGVILSFEGKTGERFGGDLERLGTTPHFAVRLGDDSLGPAWPRDALLGFTMAVSPPLGDVVLLRHRRTQALALRRAEREAWAPLVGWQLAYPRVGEWAPLGRLQAVLPRP